MFGESGKQLQGNNLGSLRQQQSPSVNLPENDERFKLFYIYSPVPYQSLDENGCIIEVNPAWLELLDYEYDEVIGRPFPDFLVPEQKTLFEERFPRFKKAGITRRVEFKMVARNSRCIDVKIDGNVAYNPDKSFKQTHCVLTDITENKRAEKLLRESEEKFRALFEQAGCCFLILDPNTSEGIPIIVDANKAAYLLYGYTREEFIGRPITDIEDEDEKCTTEERIKEIMTGKPCHFELIHVRKDGSTFPVSINSKRIDIGNGLPLIFATEYDITERKKTEDIIGKYTQQLRLLSSRLTTAEDQERRRIAENIHDNMIQPLVFLDIIVKSLDQMSRDAELKRTYERIRKTLCELIEDSRRLIFDLGNPVLYELGLEQAIEEFLHLEVEKKHHITTNLQCELQDSKLDNAVLTLVYKSVKELLVNVIKHAQAGTVNVSIVRNHMMIDVYVEDNGCGFKTSTKSLMSGFGLFNIREKVLHYGGWFDIDSKTGVGSRITFSVPLKQDCKEG